MAATINPPSRTGIARRSPTDFTKSERQSQTKRALAVCEQLQKELIRRSIISGTAFESWCAQMLWRQWGANLLCSEYAPFRWDPKVGEIRTTDMYHGHEIGDPVGSSAPTSERAAHLESCFFRYLNHTYTDAESLEAPISRITARATTLAARESLAAYITRGMEREKESPQGRPGIEGVVEDVFGVVAFSYLGSLAEMLGAVPEEASFVKKTLRSLDAQHTVVIEANYPALIDAARRRMLRVRDASIGLDDMIAEAQKIAWRCLLRYNGRKGAAYASMVIPALKSHLQRVVNEARTIRLPEDVSKALRRYFAWAAAHRDEADDLPLEQQLARAGVKADVDTWLDMESAEKASGSQSLEAMSVVESSEEFGGAPSAMALITSDRGAGAVAVRESTSTAEETIFRLASQKMSPVQSAVLHCLCPIPAFSSGSERWLRSVVAMGENLVSRAHTRIKGGVCSANHVAADLNVLFQ